MQEEEEEMMILDLSQKELSEKDIRAKMFRGYEHVNLSKNEIKSLKGFPRLTRVKSLNLSQNSLSDFHHVGEFLNKLDLSCNYFDSISELPNRLVSLSLAGNWITECTGFEHLTRLNYLDLRDNLIDSFGSVRSLSFNKNLRTLLLKGNPIERLGGAYVVFEREAREYHFYHSRSPSCHIILSRFISLTRNDYTHSNVTKYLTRASRSNTGTCH